MIKKKPSYRKLAKQNKQLRSLLEHAQKHRDEIRNMWQEAQVKITQLEKQNTADRMKQRYAAITTMMQSVAGLNEAFSRVVGEIGHTPIQQ